MLDMLLLSSLVILAQLQATYADTVTKQLDVVNTKLAPDGYERSTVVVNGKFPAPLICGNVGDQFLLNVSDHLNDPTMRRATSVHWHGLFQHHTNEMDGIAWVTQCPIVPGNSFLYNFTVPDQSGTYWYHSHVAGQYCDGLRGPLVIYDPNDPLRDLYDVDDESTVFVLADWYHQVSEAVFPNPLFVDPLPNSTLVNGLGRYLGGPSSDLAVTRVHQGKRYRFRILNTSCFPSFNFSIDEHRMAVIEADGIETQLLVVDSLVIFPAQRYSVVIVADQDIGNYWIRVNPSVGNQGYKGGINSAILRYHGAPDAEPTTLNQTGVALNDSYLVPLINPGAPGLPYPGGVDYALNLPISINFMTGRHFVNNVSWIPPSVPVLLQVLSGNVVPGSILPKGSVYELPKNSTVEISIPPGFFPHPMHLHGHSFDVVRGPGMTTYNYLNPVRRDTISTGSGPSENVTIRFVTDNYGPWFFHCHIDWHLEAGLAAVFAEDVGDVASENPVNSEWESLCPKYAREDPDKAFE